MKWGAREKRQHMEFRVGPENHTVSLDFVVSVMPICETEVKVHRDVYSTLKCSVDSKNHSDITWSTVPKLPEMIQNTTTCNLRADDIYHCTNILMLSSEYIPLHGTCHAKASGRSSVRCLLLGEKPLDILVRCGVF